jgi:hypothetical protein
VPRLFTPVQGVQEQCGTSVEVYHHDHRQVVTQQLACGQLNVADGKETKIPSAAGWLANTTLAYNSRQAPS